MRVKGVGGGGVVGASTLFVLPCSTHAFSLSPPTKGPLSLLQSRAKKGGGAACCFFFCFFFSLLPFCLSFTVYLILQDK